MATKKITILVFIALFIFTSRIYAWQIDDFEVNIDINKDSSILVTEKIVADFSDQPKHGIFRDIPISYRDQQGNSLNLQFQILDIYDENGLRWKYEEYRYGIFKRLKIGSPYQTFSTKKTFVIKYKVKGVILYLANHDELFWNAIGTEWDAPINNVTINLILPEPIKKEFLLTAAYSGRYGSRSNDVQTQIVDEEHITFKAGRYLPYEGLTIVVGWPKGIVEVSRLERTATVSLPFAKGTPTKYNWLSFALLLIIPLIVFLVMFSIWKEYGKDPQLLKSVVVEYKPPEGLLPAEIGTLIDDKIDIRDISATIIDLAVRGYLKIVKTDAMFFQRKYSFVKLKDYSQDKSLKPFEKTILKGLFEVPTSRSASFTGLANYIKVGEFVELSELENNFYKSLANIKEEIIDDLIKRGFYKNNPEKIVKLYRGFGLVLLSIAFFLFVFFPLALSLGISAIIILAFAKYMPAKTRKGMDLYGKILGFEEFLVRTDKEKIQFEQRHNIFEKMLPFAICLGISSQWAKIFADIYKQPPDWFSGDYAGGFSLNYFIYDLNRSINSMNTAFTSMPRTVSSGGGFGGGGFSGGGFGGGGGSSW